MRSLALLISLLAMPAFGQTFGRTSAFIGASNSKPISSGGWTDNYYPTNIPGYPAYAWYVGQGNYSSNNGVATWTNLTSTANVSLTNLDGTTTCPAYQSSSINGRGAIMFDGVNDYLTSALLASPNDGVYNYEFVCVLAETNQVNTKYIIQTGDGHPSFETVNTALYRLDQDSGSTANEIAGKWIVFDVVFWWNHYKVLYTNGVCAISNTYSSQQAWTGLWLGANNAKGQNKNLVMAELICYNTNLGSVDAVGVGCSGVRSNLYNYLTNKYAITP